VEPVVVVNKIDEVMDMFDFARVLQIFRALKWHWGYGEDAHIPEEHELRDTARGLLKKLKKEKLALISSGGFTARKVGKKDISLSFGIEYETNE